MHVSIVNWIKGKQLGKKKLFTQVGDDKDSPWEISELDFINSSLSPNVLTQELDFTKAKTIKINSKPKVCDQGQTPGHDGFILQSVDASRIKQKSPKSSEVIFPYLIGEDLLDNKPTSPSRYIIDFHPLDLFGASQHKELLTHIRGTVLPKREDAAREEEIRNQEVLKEDPKARVNQHHRNFLSKWWLLSYPRPKLIDKISTLPRYIICSRTTRRGVFEFVSPSIHPGDALQVFLFADDYSFGVLQSTFHWDWFNERCSTLKRDFRYTSSTVFNTFPFPQSPTLAQARKVSAAAVKLRQLRRKVMTENQWSLRELYRTLDLPGDNPLRKAHAELDADVREAYGMKAKEDPLQFLLELNFAVAEREAKGLPVIAPGLPPVVTNPNEFITDDCVRMSE